MKWLKEPLLHFLLLGALIFVAYDLLTDGAGAGRDAIVVTAAKQKNLAATFALSWQRPPTQRELDGLIDDFIRQEIAYREAQAMRLDGDDIVVRRRLRQKLEMLTEDLAELSPPTEQDLRDWLSAHGEDYRVPDLLSLQQIHFGIDEDPDAARRSAAAALARLREPGADVEAASLGDSTMLPPAVQQVSAPRLGAIFGREFVAAIAPLEPGEWRGPVASGYGLHLVRIDERIAGRVPEFAEIAPAVERDWLAARRKQAIDMLYDGLAEKYVIVIEPSAS